jgi:hypothetical protein
MVAENALTQISTALGASWASGLNIYLTMFTMGIMHASGAVVLPDGLDYLAHPLVMMAAGFMSATEFFVDKIPGVDTAWDGIHTFVRIPGGILMAYGAAEGMGEVTEIAMAILGGGLATASHATKAGSRVLINTSPEPFSNIGASVTEDVSAVTGVWVALNHPFVFLGLLAGFVLLLVWLLPKIWRGVKKIFAFMFRLFRRDSKNEVTEEPEKTMTGKPE